MKLFRWTLATIVAVGLVFVAGGLLLPSTMHVERSVVIERSPEQVFATLDPFERFNAWSPWAEYDPQARYTFEGPVQGVGARMRWVGNRAVGSGSQEIIASEPHGRIVVALDFDGKPGAGDVSAGAGSRRNTGDLGIRQRAWPESFQALVGLLFDRMIGADYEKGLARRRR